MRFYGKVGFYENSVESVPGVWTDAVTIRDYYGDVLSDNRYWNQPETLNSDLTIKNRLSILADSYAFDHFGAVRYVELYGQRWSISNVEIKRPRLIITLGGLYNGPIGTPSSTE